MNQLTILTAILLAATAPGATAQPIAGQDPEARACHYLLTDGECRIYEDRLVNSQTGEERKALLAEYSRLIEERQRLCGGHPGVAYIDYTAPQVASLSR